MPSAAAAALAALAPIAVPVQQEPAHDGTPDVSAPGITVTDSITVTDGAPTPNGATPNGTGPKAT
jgi:hypothetical protein